MKSSLNACLLILAMFLITSVVTVSAQRSAKSSDVYVDKSGVIRWSKGNTEVQGFGVNYTAPFAHAYSTAKKLNVNLEKAIDDDVYHFARLGLDAYRVHVWDCEISDTVGNLLNNEHLKLFDYMISKMKARGMKFILTPIAFWGNGWPAPDEKTPGFSTKYGKDKCLTNEEAIKAQENYLFQFLNHVNSFTGIAYKNDPDMIAFEVSNEPHHGESAEKVTTFINRMVTSMRKTGCKKPIFYNISHSIHLADAYFNADIQGGTFQWYPTGLGSRHELGGNLLPNVEKYSIPFASNPKFKSMAKIVYEFDAADVGRSYIYPAMARSFREAGMQVANHFAYDPTYMAPFNTEYGTHYMNLVYAPQKALSLKIASEVFHSIPMNKTYGNYPSNTAFGLFKVNYEDDLAEMTTDTKFIYTNHTATTPSDPEKLEHVAGWGNSPIVKYEGTGAYFLDKIGDGTWRLEVMPDAIWIKDPFERTSPKNEVAVVNWRIWPMAITLPGLGENFSVNPLNEGNLYSTKANGTNFSISPGTYLLVVDGKAIKLNPEALFDNLILKEFAAPATTLKRTYVLHKPAREISSGKPYKIEATIVSVDQSASVEVNVSGSSFRSEFLKMEKVSGYTYAVTLPDYMLKEGFINYYIVVKEKDKFHTYPSGTAGRPWEWDFNDQNSYKVRVILNSAPVYLFNAVTDSDDLSRQWIRSSSLQPLNEPGKAELLINVEKLFIPDPENKEGAKIHDYSFRYYFGKQVAGRQNDLNAKKKLVFQGRSLNDKPCPLQVALVMKDGSAFGGILTVNPVRGDYEISLSELKKVKLVTLPRPYPTFLPYYFESTNGVFDLNSVECLQFSIGPGLTETQLNEKNGIAIVSVRLE